MATDPSLNTGTVEVVGDPQVVPMVFHHLVILLVAFVPLSLCIVVGNGMVIATVVRERQLHTPPNFILASLAVADLLTGSITVPFEIYTDARVEGIDCHTMTYMLAPTYLLSAVSLVHQIVVTAERLVAICCPLRYREHVTKHRVIATLVTVWMGGIFIAGVYLYVWIVSLAGDDGNDAGITRSRGLCGGGVYYPARPIVQFEISLSVLVLFALFLLTVSNLYIWRVARRQANQIEVLFRAMDAERKRKRPGNIQATNTVLLIVGSFVVSWTPYTAYVLYGASSTMDSLGYTGVLAANQTSFYLIALNSALNPVIYGWKNKVFRRALKNMICNRTNFANVQI